MNSTAENPQPEKTPPTMVERLRGLWRGKTEEGEKPSQVLVITNPAAGQDQPFLKPVNEIFRGANLYWNVDLTMEMGDGRRLAQEAVAKGVHTVVAFGGDGTVVDVASGLVGKQVPLGILPGGTSNMMSRAFGIPQDIQAAARLIADPDAHRLYPIYIGNAGEHFFQQLVGIGMEAQMVEGADRQAKDRLGFFAYIVAGLRALTSPKNARYRIEMDDGQVVEEDGVTCLIAKVGNLGIPSLEKSENTADSDSPLMDIVVIREANIPALVNLAGTVVSGNEDASKLPHWQAHRVTVTSDPPQPIQADGEVIGKTPITVEIIPTPVQLIVPVETADKKLEMKEPK